MRRRMRKKKKKRKRDWGVELSTVACAPAPKNGGRVFTSSLSPRSALYLSSWGRSSQSWLPFSCMKRVMAVMRPSSDGIGPTKELWLRYRDICMPVSAPSSVGISPDRWLYLIGASRGGTRQRRRQGTAGQGRCGALRGAARRCAALRGGPLRPSHRKSMVSLSLVRRPNCEGMGPVSRFPPTSMPYLQGCGEAGGVSADAPARKNGRHRSCAEG